MKYIPRIVDKELDDLLKSSGAVLISGPKACGKTTTAMQKAKSVISFEDPARKESLLFQASHDIWSLYKNETPILFDEWQEANGIWDATKMYVDSENKMGLVILTGSVNEKGEKLHSGVGRIRELKMRTMSLYESGESSGEISLSALFNGKKDIPQATSPLSFDDLVFSICRGGWPESLIPTEKKYQLEVPINIYNEIIENDVINADGVKRNKRWVRLILEAYAKGICNVRSSDDIYNDIREGSEKTLSRKTFDRYVNVLKNLYVIEDIEPWCPNIRSRASIISTPKKNFTDPSLAVAALGVNTDYLKNDLNLLGFLFESLCLRDLSVYSMGLGGELSYFRTRQGLEADVVIHLRDKRYALLECKLSDKEIEKGAKHLNEIEAAILARDEKEENKSTRYGKPAFKAVVTAFGYAHLRDDGVYEIPLACLKD